VNNNNFVKVATTGEIQNSETKLKKVKPKEELEICVAYAEGDFYAIGDICTHAGCSLSDGYLRGYEVNCACHGSKFDVRNGSVIAPPPGDPGPIDPEPTYELKVENDNVLIKIPK
jgi:nitrite reductase/ring-hydroxylating ferredoxin subunit